MRTAFQTQEENRAPGSRECTIKITRRKIVERIMWLCPQYGNGCEDGGCPHGKLHEKNPACETPYLTCETPYFTSGGCRQCRPVRITEHAVFYDFALNANQIAKFYNDQWLHITYNITYNSSEFIVQPCEPPKKHPIIADKIAKPMTQEEAMQILKKGL
ncbi:MAG: hypothetical protein PHE15_06550, partial [Dehalococcoidales bacterium]|nr:hypothetical protein [Dehalococcoidales bacterium]